MKDIKIPGYSQIFSNGRSGNSGGIMLPVKENIRTVTLEVTQEKEIGQSLWILLDNNRITQEESQQVLIMEDLIAKVGI